MKLSIIIPAYNAARFIERCLDSIYSLNLHQSHFEVIVVDDCSQDNTIDIVADYAKPHSNLTLLKQSANHRQGAARNLALQYAKGEYITYVDADDAVTNDFCKVLERADSQDVVIGRKIVENAKGTLEINRLVNEPLSIVTGKEFMSKYYDWNFVGGPVAYLFKREFLLSVNIPFAEDVATEDEDWINIHLYLAKSIISIPETMYLYYYNSSSTTKTKRTLFMDASRILCSYREFQYADTYCKDDKERYDWFREIATHHIEMTFKRLWKTECVNYLPLFTKIDKTIRTYLLQTNRWSLRTRLMLQIPILSCFALTLIAPILRMLKKYRNE